MDNLLVHSGAQSVKAYQARLLLFYGDGDCFERITDLCNNGIFAWLLK